MTAVLRLVVGHDGSPAADAAFRWAVTNVAAGGTLHVVEAIPYRDELAVDAALGDSVRMRRRHEERLAERCRAMVTTPPDGVTVETSVVEGAPGDRLLEAARTEEAHAIVVGHHPQLRFGPAIVGHVTAELLRHTDRPVVVVPVGWQDDEGAGDPIVVGVGVAAATEAALRWAAERAVEQRRGLALVHALGPRSLFRPDGLLDVLAYHLDPTVVPIWVAEDLTELATRISAEVDAEVDMAISIGAGRISRHLVEAGHRARLIVVGLGEAPFGRHAMAPYLRKVLADAPCPVAVVPPAGR